MVCEFGGSVWVEGWKGVEKFHWKYVHRRFFFAS